MQTLQDIVTALDLEPHPEGGYYRRTFKNAEGPATEEGGNRGFATAIYYLAEGSAFSQWHRTDGDELWFWHAGAPLTLEIREDDGNVVRKKLGCDIALGQEPQHLAPKNKWQRAKSDGDWTLVSCSVSPGFLFETFELEEA